VTARAKAKGEACESSARPTRERIFEAALRLLREGGTKVATMRAICDEAGVKAPTLYHYFGDMQGLYRAVVEDIVEKARGPKAAAGDLSPRERIDDTWRSHVRVAQDEPGLFDLWNRHLAWDRLSITSLRSYQILEGAFGELSTEHPMKMKADVAAYIFWAAAHGVACLISASQHDGVPCPDGAAEALKRAVLDGIFERNPL